MATQFVDIYYAPLFLSRNRKKELRAFFKAGFLSKSLLDGRVVVSLSMLTDVFIISVESPNGMVKKERKIARAVYQKVKEAMKIHFSEQKFFDEEKLIQEILKEK